MLSWRILGSGRSGAHKYLSHAALLTFVLRRLVNKCDRETFCLPVSEQYVFWEHEQEAASASRTCRLRTLYPAWHSACTSGCNRVPTLKHVWLSDLHTSHGRDGKKSERTKGKGAATANCDQEKHTFASDRDGIVSSVSTPTRTLQVSHCLSGPTYLPWGCASQIVATAMFESEASRTVVLRLKGLNADMGRCWDGWLMKQLATAYAQPLPRHWVPHPSPVNGHQAFLNTRSGRRKCLVRQVVST